LEISNKANKRESSKAAQRDADDLRLALNIAQGARHEVLKS